MIRGAIFDMDGTLLNSMGFWREMGARYLRSKGKTPEPNLEDKLFEMTMEESRAYMRQAYHLEESLDEISREIDQIILDFYTHEAQAKPGVAEFLEELRRASIPMVVATNTPRSPAEAALGRLGLLDHFQQVFTCSEVGLSKTDPRIFHLAARSLGSQPADTWVFEDALFAARTARAAGFPVAAVYDYVSEKDQQDLRELASLYLPDFSRAMACWEAGDFSR